MFRDDAASILRMLTDRAYLIHREKMPCSIYTSVRISVALGPKANSNVSAIILVVLNATVLFVFIVTK